MVAKYLVVLLAITLLVWGNYNVSATEFVVGDAAGWNVPDSPTTYSSWASEHNFSIGDILVFNFTSGSHTVALVNKTAFETCNTDDTISVTSQSPSKVPLQEIGQLHFICTIGAHCSSGQKLTINVSDHSSSSSSSSSPPLRAPVSAPLSSSSPSNLTPLAIVSSASFVFFLLVDVLV
ncbi:umecyanin-like [Beta vulgaris subsp. vulgaris]|uniref:umecyanin-like n=1 Tax=Beta vulgaris subsp. vulgaris TaxID=3555 RepID=UPI0025492B91|nr:umecyanin-like [Beta vulgaris subsp. vulgaris]